MKDLTKVLDDIEAAVVTARRAVEKGDFSNALYNVDHAEIEIMLVRNRLVDIIHNGI